MTPIEGHAGAHPVRISQEPDTRITTPDVRLHSKIVEILSSTSNGCLTELGYHPGIAEKLHQYMTRIQTLEGENAKLYQDNCQLSSHVQLLDERVAHLSVNQTTQLQQFATMQERLRTLETERNKLVDHNQEILIHASRGTSHHLLSTELARVKAQAARVLQEMTVLRFKYMRLVTERHGRTSPGGVLSPSDPVPRTIHPQFPILSDVRQRRSSADGVPRLQPVCLPQQQVPQQPQHHLRPMQEQVQYVFPQPQQLQHGQQVQTQRRSSANPYLPQRLVPTAIRTIPPPASAPPTFGARSPATNFALPPPMSAPLNPIRPHELLHTIPLTHVPQPAYPTASAQALNELQSSVLRLSPPLTIDLTELEPNERMAEQPARDGQIDQPISLKRTSCAVDGALVQDNEAIKRQRTAEPIQTPQDPIVNEKPVLPDSKPASDATSPGQVGESNDEVPIPPTPSDTVAGSNPTSPVSAGPSPHTPLAGENRAGPQSKDDTRSVEDCIFMIYEQDAETTNGYFCGRCLDRFEAGMLPDTPEVLICPKLEDLFMHCTKEHPTIWDDLRYKRDLDLEGGAHDSISAVQ